MGPKQAWESATSGSGDRWLPVTVTLLLFPMEIVVCVLCPDSLPWGISHLPRLVTGGLSNAEPIPLQRQDRTVSQAEPLGSGISQEKILLAFSAFTLLSSMHNISVSLVTLPPYSPGHRALRVGAQWCRWT